jgi:hypothetical protein
MYIVTRKCSAEQLLNKDEYFFNRATSVPAKGTVPLSSPEFQGSMYVGICRHRWSTERSHTSMSPKIRLWVNFVNQMRNIFGEK